MTDHPVKMQAELIKELNGLPPMCAIETAFQAGADQELEACCEWLNRCGFYQTSNHLRATRRPKPPTLAEQAGAAHARASFGKPGDRDILAAALNRLAKLEAQQ
jgi:hypothetical protein